MARLERRVPYLGAFTGFITYHNATFRVPFVILLLIIIAYLPGCFYTFYQFL